eukprot:4956094-Amphidinium_carterae.1
MRENKNSTMRHPVPFDVLPATPPKPLIWRETASRKSGESHAVPLGIFGEFSDFFQDTKLKLMETDVNVAEAFRTHPDISLMRSKFSDEFMFTFGMGYQNYAEGVLGNGNQSQQPNSC